MSHVFACRRGICIKQSQHRTWILHNQLHCLKNLPWICSWEGSIGWIQVWKCRLKTSVEFSRMLLFRNVLLYGQNWVLPIKTKNLVPILCWMTQWNIAVTQKPEWEFNINTYVSLWRSFKDLTFWKHCMHYMLGYGAQCSILNITWCELELLKPFHELKYSE